MSANWAQRSWQVGPVWFPHRRSLAYIAAMRTPLLALTTSLFILGAAAPVAAQTASSTGSIKIKVLDTGKGKKRALRYKLTANRSELARMRMTMEMKMEMAGTALPEQALPGMEFGMKFTVGKMVNDHEARYGFEITSTNATQRPGVAEPVLVAVRKALKGVQGLTGSAIVDTRGANRDVKLDTSKVSAEAQQMMQGMQQGLEQLAVPLPAEAVGKGARWEATQNLEQNGMKLVQTTTFELVSLDGNKGKLKVSIRQRAPRQKITSNGISFDLASHQGSGVGTVDFDLSRLTPNSKVKMNATSVMEMAAGGKTQAITVELGMTMELAPGA